MKKFLSYLLHALFFFTRIPVGLFMRLDEKTLIASRVMLPLVGLILGVLLAALYLILLHIFPSALVMIFLLLALVLLTGGFHEDALADSVDGFGGSHSGKDIITIMKDSRVGTFGSLALIFSFLIAYVSLVEIPSANLPFVLIVAITASRFSALPLMWRLPYVRHGSTLEKLFKTQKNSITGMGMLLAGLFTLLVSFLLLQKVGIMLFVAVCVVSVVTGWYYQKRLGGATGDCFGATIKLSELACLICAAVVYNV